MPSPSQLLVELFLDVFCHIFVVLELAVMEHLASFLADGDYLCLLVLMHVDEAISRHNNIEILLLRLSYFLRHFKFKYYNHNQQPRGVLGFWGFGVLGLIP